MLSEMQYEKLKELLFRLDKEVFKDFVRYELSQKNRVMADLVYELIEKLEIAGNNVERKNEYIKKLINE